MQGSGTRRKPPKQQENLLPSNGDYHQELRRIRFLSQDDDTVLSLVLCENCGEKEKAFDTELCYTCNNKLFNCD